MLSEIFCFKNKDPNFKLKKRELMSTDLYVVLLFFCIKKLKFNKNEIGRDFTYPWF